MRPIVSMSGNRCDSADTRSDGKRIVIGVIHETHYINRLHTRNALDAFLSVARLIVRSGGFTMALFSVQYTDERGESWRRKILDSAGVNLRATLVSEDGSVVL